MSVGISVGQEVFATRDIVKPADDHSPAMLLASRGEKLIVRDVPGRFWWAYVSHPEVTNNSFGVDASEVTTVKP